MKKLYHIRFEAGKDMIVQGLLFGLIFIPIFCLMIFFSHIFYGTEKNFSLVWCLVLVIPGSFFIGFFCKNVQRFYCEKQISKIKKDIRRCKKNIEEFQSSMEKHINEKIQELDQEKTIFCTHLEKEQQEIIEAAKSASEDFSKFSHGKFLDEIIQQIKQETRVVVENKKKEAEMITRTSSESLREFIKEEVNQFKERQAPFLKKLKNELHFYKECLMMI